MRSQFYNKRKKSMEYKGMHLFIWFKRSLLWDNLFSHIALQLRVYQIFIARIS